MVRIALRRFGVEDSFADTTLEVLNSFYNRVKNASPQLIDLYLFGRSSAMNAFLGREKARLGIGTSDLDSSFFAIHDAWRGIPRIVVAQDKLSELPRKVVLGVLHHEAAHTILHGSLEFYTFPVPMSILRLERKGLIPKQLSRGLLYAASVAVKDYEVTRLLLEKSYVEDQVAYNKYLLETSEEEKKVWQSIDESKPARLLYLVSLLKTALCAAPLLEDERYGKEMAECVAVSVSHLPRQWRKHLSKMLRAASGFSDKTHENVALLMDNIAELLQVDA